MTSPISDALAALRSRFANQLPTHLETIRAQFEGLKASAWHRAEAEQLHRLVHGITGSAGTFGMRSVSDAARAVEQQMATLIKTGKAPSRAQWHDIGEALARLDQLARIELGSSAQCLQPLPGVKRLDRSPLIHLVEDDREQAEHLRQVLRDAGYRAQTFTQPAMFRAATGNADAERPSAVIIDMIFPEGDDKGARLIAELGLGKESAIPVVIASVRDDLPGRLAAFRAGACRYMHKPVEPERLIDLLDELTGRQPQQPYRVLLVDDDPSLLAAEAPVLRATGMDVRTLSQPLQTLDAVEKFRPDVLVLDLYMPEASGPELAAVLRERDAQQTLPILFLSAETDMSRQLLALNLGGDDFLVKPVQPDHLVAAVTARARRARQNNTIRRRLETTLYEREREHLALNEHAIVSTADASGNITYVNDRFCMISGFPRSELLGRNLRVLESGEHPVADDPACPEDNGQDLWETISGGNVWHGEICNRRKDGSLYWVESTITPFLDSNGKPYQYVDIRTDITERTRTAQALVAARDAAQHANRAKSEFLSLMSHELRTPMNSILGFGQLLECDDTLSEEQQDNVQEILKAGQHLLELINEVLDLAKVESGRIDLSLEPVEVDPVIAASLNLMSTLADKYSIRLTQGGRRGAIVRADRTRFKQALLNLLSNAIKYNREGGRVELAVHARDASWLRIAITDNGRGIPAERLPELFQPFNRLELENSKIEGTGIGLTLTRRIVELMGGAVGVESTLGKGSTFWIELPAEHLADSDRDPAREGETIVHPIPAARGEPKQQRVLYIEDNPASLKLVAQILGRHPHIHLLTAHTPRLGIELAQIHCPDLILLDINLPGMDGYQVLQALKANSQLEDTPVVAITANAMPRDINRGKARGFANYLTKPIDVPKFFALLERYLRDGARPHR